MTTKKPDRRTERTERALMSAFIALLLTRGYNSVTVGDIVEKADVGRSTFYIHFTGKEDMLKRAMTQPSRPLALMVGGDVTPEMIAPSLEHFHSQRKLNGAFFATPIRSIWVRCLAGLIEPRLAAIARNSGARPLLPLPLIALQLAEAQIILVSNWLGGKFACKPETVAEALIADTSATVSALLRSRAGASLLIPGENLKSKDARPG